MERCDLAGSRRRAVRLREDCPIDLHKGEPDGGDCVRGGAAHIQKSEASRDDTGAAPAVDDLAAATVSADHQTPRMTIPGANECVTAGSLISATPGHQEEEDRAQEKGDN